MAQTTVGEEYYYQGFFVIRLVNIIVGIIEGALILRVILELFGANSSSPFVGWLYGVTNAIIAPFVGIFSSLNIGSGMFVIDTVAIVAMIGYAILGWIVIKLLSLIFFSWSRI